jgi:hypothetical protein
MRSTTAQAHAALVELAGRYSVGKASTEAPSRFADLLATLQPRQRAFIRTKARRVALLGTRRSGKTTTSPVGLFDAAERNPDCVVLFLGRTRIRAKQLVWKSLCRANKEYRLGYKENHTELTLTHPSNGAEVRLDGMDNLSELEKKRGDKLAEVWIEEAQSIPEDVLRKAIEDVLWPALLDVSGVLRMMGTPGYVLSGLWYEVTRNEDDASRAQRASGWEVFEWSGLDNPALNHKGERICDLFAAELTALEADPAKGPKHPSVVREYRGRWCNDTKGLYYAFNPALNLYDGRLPEGHHWRYVMGVDLGKKYARVTWAFSETHPVAYEVAGHKQPCTNANDWKAQTLQGLDGHPIEAAPVDYGGLGVGIIEAWQQDGLPVEFAEKQHKDSFVMLFNAALEAGQVKVLRGGAYAGELATLPKDPDSPPAKPPQPKAGFDDHCCDAGLYGWRRVRSLCGADDKPAPPPGSQQAERERLAEVQRAYLEKIQRQRDYQESDTW